MNIRALDAYDFPAKDVQDNFPAPLLYIGWDEHLMFCAPVCLPLPPETPFSTLINEILPGVYGQHPDFAQIDWSQTQWLKSGKPWKPDTSRSLSDNGLGHKDVIRFRTPGLQGIANSCS